MKSEALPVSTCENLALFCRALILNSDSKFGCTVDVTLTSSGSY